MTVEDLIEKLKTFDRQDKVAFVVYDQAHRVLNKYYEAIDVEKISDNEATIVAKGVRYNEAT